MTIFKTGILIICRLNSKRLKRKILEKISNKTLLEILILRLLKKFNKKKIIICSSILSRNKDFKKISQKYKVGLFYGSDRDIFSRMIGCAKKFNLNNVVRVTGDNPLTDPNAILKMIKSHEEKFSDYTYTTNLMNGTRSEIFNVNALKICKKLAYDRFSSEYMTYFFLRKKIFKLNRVKFKEIFNNQNKISITVDYKKDLLLVKKILKKNRLHITHNEILKFLKKNKLYKKTYFNRYIKLKNNKYNVYLKTDYNANYIDLKKFGYK